MSSFSAQTRLILRNDLRLLWRDIKASRSGFFLNLAFFAVVFALLNAIVIVVFFSTGGHPPIALETFGWLFFCFVMLGAAMNHAIAVLFERADFDLLLASPVSARAILLARLTAMFVGTALSIALFLLPILNGALLAVSWKYAAGYVVWLLLSCAVASSGVWFTLLLVRWLGPRRARIWAQVVAGILGAGLFLLTQGANLMPGAISRDRIMAAGRLLGEPPLSLIASAGRGEWRPLLGLALVTVLFAALTARLLGRMFVSGVQEAGGVVPSKRRSTGARRYVFVQGVARATFWKDVRLILRDPLLIAQTLPTALYMLPALFGAMRIDGVGLTGVLAPLALAITTQFSVVFTNVSAAGEECWDLIRMSPTAELKLRYAKMAAGMALPMLFCAIICAMLAILGRPGIAILALVVTFACAAGCSWMGVARITPTPRRDIVRPRRGANAGENLGRSMVTIAIMLVGAAGLACAAGGLWLVASVLLGIMALAVVGCFTLVEMEAVRGRHFQASSAQLTPAE